MTAADHANTVCQASQVAANARRALDKWYSSGTDDPDEVVMYAENLIGMVRALLRSQREAVTGDRLARIEALAREQGVTYPKPSVSKRDVLALVNIAKAARPMADHPWPMSYDERREWILDQNRLRDALNAIGKGVS